MNVYDFDGTIYPTDCSIDFCFWSMKRHPKANMGRNRFNFIKEELAKRERTVT